MEAVSQVHIYSDNRLGDEVYYKVIALEGVSTPILFHDFDKKGIKDISREIFNHLEVRPDDLMIMFAGSNDLIVREQDSIIPEDRRIKSVSTEMQEVFNHMNYIIDEFEQEIAAKGRDYNISLCPISTIDLEKYAPSSDNKGDHGQNSLDIGIMAVNKRIVEFNMRRVTPTPWTANEVHHCRKNKIQICYDLLLDGYAPDVKLIDWWAKDIHKAVMKYESKNRQD